MLAVAKAGAYRTGMKTKASSILCVTVVWSLFALVVGCSSFNRRWQAAPPHAPPAPAPTTDQIIGRWEGTWKSDMGHSGLLRCIITKTGPSAYSASYHAVYWNVLQFDYALPLTAEQRGEQTLFKGQADLGMLAGGVYRFDGHATATDFYSTYESKDDHGFYEMKRPPATQPATKPGG